MNRRTFLGSTLAAGAVATLGDVVAGAQDRAASPRRSFKLRYAPHFGMFKDHVGEDPLEELRFMADQGFTALEDNGMASRAVEQQEAIAREMQRLNIAMGVFVAIADFGNPIFVRRGAEARDALVKQMHAAVEVAKRVHATWMTVVPGAFDARQEWDYQTAACVDNLKACAEVLEPHGLIMVLEPLNPWRDHPGLFLTKIPQAYLICRAVGSPSCKILDDLYHQQITEGNLIPNIDKAWDEIAYFQVGDNPGRREPGTGEINYRNVFKHIHSKGFKGIVGMEHGVAGEGKPGEVALIDAYVAADSF